MYLRFLKATVGYLILTVGSTGLVTSFRPILVGLKERFHLSAMVTDPYFGQNAVTAGIEKTFGRTFGDTMLLLLIAFIFNILLVRFKSTLNCVLCSLPVMFKSNKPRRPFGFCSSVSQIWDVCTSYLLWG